jgi:hypothetical protein
VPPPDAAATSRSSSRSGTIIPPEGEVAVSATTTSGSMTGSAKPPAIALPAMDAHIIAAHIVLFIFSHPSFTARSFCILGFFLAQIIGEHMVQIRVGAEGQDTTPSISESFGPLRVSSVSFDAAIKLLRIGVVRFARYSKSMFIFPQPTAARV